MKGPTAFRALSALVVLGASTFVTLTASPQLGLDLEGGTQIVLETQDTETVEADAEATDRALEVLRRRVDALGVSEPTLARSGENRIIIELPGLQDPEEAAEVIGKTAQLTFHQVAGVSNEPAPSAPQATPTPGTTPTPEATPTPEPTPTDGPLVLPDENGQMLELGPVALTGEGVDGSDAGYDINQGGWYVTIDFNGDGSGAWRELTGAAACAPVGDPARRIAIVLDGEIISSPQVDESIGCDVGMTGGSTQITGDFTQDEAENLAALIEGGSLPVPVETIEQRTIGATLGDDAIRASAIAALIGVGLTAVFILATYRLVGLIAVLALLGYSITSYAMLVALGATLTLPGLAGFVLAIGMAVDANVLVFERAREDYVEGRTKSLRAAVQSGFKNALSAIADSNVTTLLAAALLFYLAAGPVRGFGVTLTLGVLASLFSALVLSRVLIEWLVDRKWVRNHPDSTGIAHHGRVRLWLRDRNPNLMKHTMRWLVVSGVAVVIAIGGMGTRGLDFGIEFTGGRTVEVSTTEPVDVEDARAVVADAGFPTAIVQESGDDNISVRTSEMSDAESKEIAAAIGELGGGSEVVRDELIGPSLGDELLRNAFIAFVIALAAQLAYLAFRFRWTYGAGAVVALFQNVIVTLGIFAWLGKPIDGIFLAAILTIIGYTVNDSVVVFDRIRETWRASKGESFGAVCNTAILNTLPRTVNTGVSTLFILTALLLLGGESLSDFALALLLGIVIGTYSSNFTATPLAIELERRWPAAPPPPKKKVEPRGRRTRDDPNYGAVV